MYSLPPPTVAFWEEVSISLPWDWPSSCDVCGYRWGRQLKKWASLGGFTGEAPAVGRENWGYGEAGRKEERKGGKRRESELSLQRSGIWERKMRLRTAALLWKIIWERWGEKFLSLINVWKEFAGISSWDWRKAWSRLSVRLGWVWSFLKTRYCAQTDCEATLRESHKELLSSIHKWTEVQWLPEGGELASEAPSDCLPSVP